MFLTFYYLNKIDLKGNLDTLGTGYILWLMIWFISIASLLVTFIYKRAEISKTVKTALMILGIISFVIYLSGRLKLFDIDFVIVSLSVYNIILAIFLLFISFLDNIEIILLGLVPVIVIGFIINRFGIEEGGVIIPVAFFLSSVGFIYLAIRSLPKIKKEKNKVTIFFIFYLVIGILNALFLIKFMGTLPALNNLYDTIGVILFLLTSLAMFIILPFSNFTEWAKEQKVSFRRIILTPLILFLLIFSLKFLLPGKIYRNIFFKEFSKKEEVHFNMKDYVIDFSEK